MPLRSGRLTPALRVLCREPGEEGGKRGGERKEDGREEEDEIEERRGVPIR